MAPLSLPVAGLLLALALALPSADALPPTTRPGLSTILAGSDLTSRFPRSTPTAVGPRPTEESLSWRKSEGVWRSASQGSTSSAGPLPFAVALAQLVVTLTAPFALLWAHRRTPVLTLLAASGGPSKEPAPPTDNGADEEEPVWIRRERERANTPAEIPFGLYLLFSVIICIAAVGSTFELINGNAIFGVIPKESPFWAPILWWWIVTGFPLAGYLLYRAVDAANAMARRMDEADGY